MGKVATNVPIARTCTSLLIPRVTLRSFSSTPAVFTVTQKNKKNKNFDKFYKILKYTKPIDETQYEIGQQHPKGLRIPSAIPEFPKYKYEARFFKRRNRGLYGGLQRKRSKTCSEYFNKNLRAHRPNIRRAKLWSEILNEKINVKVTTRELKPVTYIHKPDGRKFIATKQELLAALYDLVQRDSYYPIKPAEFDRQYSWLPMSEIVNRLDAYEYDFSGKVVV